MLAVDRAPIHARQFVLGPSQRKEHDDWTCLPIDDRLILSHCPRLRVRQITDRVGRRWSLLGLAVQSDPARESPEEELAAYGQGDIASVYESWAGRWIMIGEGQLHLDPGGLLGCYYLQEAGDPPAGPWLSSSLALLSELGGQEVPESRRRCLTKGDGFCWDPPPRTCYAGIAKLLPTQSLDLASGRVLPRKPFPDAAPAITYEELLDRVAECLTTTVRNLADADRQLWVALSAGYHSRLLLAAALNAGAEFRTYTQTFPLMLRADRELPAELSNAVGVEYVVRSPGAEVATLRDRMDKHSHGQYVDADRTFYAKRQWDWPGPADIALRGGGFELGQCYYWPLLADRPGLDRVLAAFGAELSPGYVKDGLADYLAWVSRHPIADMDWRDRWYLDIRLGGWQSTEEQALDLLSGTSFIPGNNARLYRLLLQVPTEVRQSKRHFVDLIDRLWPGLTAYPFNARDSVLQGTIRRLHKYASIFHQTGAWNASYQLGAALRRRLHRA